MIKRAGVFLFIITQFQNRLVFAVFFVAALPPHGAVLSAEL
jgi:hypothetical protein